MHMNRATLTPNFLLGEIPERLSDDLRSIPWNSGVISARDLLTRIEQCGLRQLMAEYACLNDKSAVFQALLADYAGGLLSFAAGDLALHQLSFISSVLNAIPGLAAERKRSVLQGESLCSRLLYHQTEFGQWGQEEVRADLRQSGWCLNGDLPVLLMAQDTDWHLVFAAVDGDPGLSVFMLGAKSPGIIIQTQTPVSTDGRSVLVKASLRNVVLNKEQCMGRVSIGCIAKLMAESRVLEACRLNSRARTILDSSIEFLRTRRSVGRPLLERDVLLHRLAALDAECSMTRAFSFHAIEASLAGDAIHCLAKRCKYLSSTLMQNIADAALHLGGITHYRSDSPIARSYQEACWNALLVERDEDLLAGV